ncbi:MAG: SPOR domain-containing protein [Spirochaetes bacterium]|nr:SPOR domain-containing protein [Spirochaetota bacterium]
MSKLRRPYQMYVLNLDAGRIFWLTMILLLLLAFSFFAGLLVGKVKTDINAGLVSQKNRQTVDELINRLDDKKSEESDYEFYDLMKPDDKKNISVSVPPEFERNNESQGENVSRSESKPMEPSISLGDSKISSSRPFTIQVASYEKYSNARKLNDQLNEEQFPAYIIRSRVNGKLFYRIRVGPFASKALSIKVLEQLRYKKGCQNSFITQSK